MAPGPLKYSATSLGGERDEGHHQQEAHREHEERPVGTRSIWFITVWWFAQMIPIVRKLTTYATYEGHAREQLHGESGIATWHDPT